MTVQELINHLSTLPLNSPVVIQYTDHTDYTYVSPINKDDVEFEEEVYCDSGFDKDDGYYIKDENDDSDGDEDDNTYNPMKNCVVINFYE